MQLIAVRAEQQAAAALSMQHGTQLVPGDFKLRGGTRVAELVQASELQQNVQASHKSAGCCGFCVGTHSSLAAGTQFGWSGNVNAIVGATQSCVAALVAYLPLEARSKALTHPLSTAARSCVLPSVSRMFEPLPQPKASAALLFIISLYIGWSVLAAIFPHRVDWSSGFWHPRLLLYYTLVNTFAAALSIAFLRVVDGQGPRFLGLSIDSGPAGLRRWLSQLAAGVAAGGVVISATALLLATSGGAHVVLFAAAPPAGVLFLGAFLLLAALLEELAFRGYLLTRLADSWGPTLAVVTSSVLFGIVHLGNPYVTPLSTCNTALAGVLLAIARLRGGTLWMPWALHFTWNFALGLVFSFPVSGLAFGAHPLSQPLPGPLWLSGGSYGPEGSVALTGVLVVAIPLLLSLPLPVPRQPLLTASNQR